MSQVAATLSSYSPASLHPFLQTQWCHDNVRRKKELILTKVSLLFLLDEIWQLFSRIDLFVFIHNLKLHISIRILNSEIEIWLIYK